MSRKCGGTCTDGAVVCRVSAEYSMRCVQRAWESARAWQGWQGSTEHRECRVGQLSGKCAKSVI
jgi:heme-degrading monooxygenase HmoA